jgi:hypothetical protein
MTTEAQTSLMQIGAAVALCAYSSRCPRSTSGVDPRSAKASLEAEEPARSRGLVILSARFAPRYADRLKGKRAI